MGIVRLLLLVVFFILTFVIMVANAGWVMTGYLVATIAAPFVVFNLIPYLLGSRSAGSGTGNKGYFFGYEYKFGARPPKF